MMSGWITYAATLMAVTAAPGPIVAILVSRGLSGDGRGAVLFAAGVILGDLAAVALVVAGMGQWLLSLPMVLAAVQVVGAGYIFWIAHTMWRTCPEPAAVAEAEAAAAAAAQAGPGPRSTLGAGFMLSCASPQTMLMYLALLPLLISLTPVDLPLLAVLAPVTVLALAVVLGGAVAGSLIAARLMLRGAPSPVWNRAMATFVGLSGVWVLTV